ncbi:glycosyltransferase family 4 protein [Sebaldella sp. S0638]|uniref:glycosyltransferase family 4 protein n=1 Tax=Sebaldella sp. S0638 TaxID=2957809 RepID=UPI0020A1DC42|nr:glycosyltransferase family 4 protein [Sebaldella sp. S0638]MCP1223116.1 glycosyltransferase family 4 protein [Sebaldella sp. S0638]
MMKAALLVEEFFDKELGGYGGYGMLAREYIAEYIPGEGLELETFLERSKNPREMILDGNKKVSYIPKPDIFHPFKLKKYLEEKKIDIYLSIECQRIVKEVFKYENNKKLILWIQDPRPHDDWDKIRSLNGDEYESYLNYYSKNEKDINDLLSKLISEKRLILITQGKYLKDKAKRLYNLPDDIPIDFVPNPVRIPEFDIEKKPETNIITFLGRLSNVKRPWIFLEMAKQLPQYEFYVCGVGHEKYQEDYKDIKNIKFFGHINGEEKEDILTKTQILVNTSIHEAIPISFLEALSYGASIVSCQNPDDITEMFGKYIGKVSGEGHESIEKFVLAVKELMENRETLYNNRKNGREYVCKVHSIEKFTQTLRKIITENIKE